MNHTVSYVLNALWQAPLFVLAGWLVSRLGRRLHPAVLHGLWPAMLVLSVIVPAVGMVREWFIGTGQSGTASVWLLAGNADRLPRGSWFDGGVLVLSRPWMYGLAGGFVLITALTAVRLAVGIGRARKLARVAAMVTLPAAQQEIWHRCRTVFNVTHATLCISESVSGPAVIGCRRPALLLPPAFLAETADEELLAALSHECAHMARQDYLLNLVYECLALPIAWHPATMFVKKQIAQTREVACDRRVAEAMMPPAQYAAALLRLASRVPALDRPGVQPAHVAVGIFDGDILEERIMHLQAERVAMSWAGKLGIMAAAVALAASCAVSAVALTVDVDPSSAADATGMADDEVFHVGGDVSAPVLVYTVDPEYSEQARRAKYQGVCLLQIVVDTKGRTKHVEVLRPLGMGLDEKAIQTVKKYRFKPALRNGKPVAVAVKVEVNFRIY